MRLLLQDTILVILNFLGKTKCILMEAMVIGETMVLFVDSILIMVTGIYCSCKRKFQLLNLFFDKHFAMQGITIEDLNFVLGIKQKNESVQKKNRSEVLQKLNLKLMMLLEVKDDILVKKRLSEDKRSFTYHMKTEYVSNLLNLLK